MNTSRFSLLIAPTIASATSSGVSVRTSRAIPGMPCSAPGLCSKYVLATFPGTTCETLTPEPSRSADSESVRPRSAQRADA